MELLGDKWGLLFRRGPALPTHSTGGRGPHLGDSRLVNSARSQQDSARRIADNGCVRPRGLMGSEAWGSARAWILAALLASVSAGSCRCGRVTRWSTRGGRRAGSPADREAASARVGRPSACLGHGPMMIQRAARSDRGNESSSHGRGHRVPRLHAFAGCGSGVGAAPGSAADSACVGIARLREARHDH
jgi:hypothetical protein